VISLPSLLANGAANFAWVSALLGIVFEFILVLIAVLIVKHFRNRPVFLKIIYVIFIPILILELLLVTKTTYTLIHESFFDNVNIILFAAPLLAAGVFFCMSPARSFFRAGEILWGIVLIGLVIAIIPTIYSINWSDFNILIHGNIKSVLPATLSNLLYFESAIFIIVFSADMKIEKKTRFAGKLLTTATVCGLFFVAITALFTVYFGPLSPEKTLAFTEFTTVSQYITNTGSFDWLLSCTWLVMLLLRFGVMVSAGFICVKEIMGIKKRGRNV
jgi:hypothetical protein